MVAAETARGRRIYLATSKAHVYAKPILEHFGLASHFAGVYGAELDGTRVEKPDLLAYICEREGLARGEAIMVGAMARPSRPSVRLTALLEPTITR